MTRFTAIIRTAAPGISRRARLRRAGSPPAIAPMMRELTARPAHPQVMTKPMAVPRHAGKGVADQRQRSGKDRRHGDSGEEDKSRSHIRIPGAEHEECGDGHGDGSGHCDGDGGNVDEDRRHADAANQQAERKSKRKNIQRARGRMPCATRWRGSQFQTPTSQEI